MVGVDRTIVLLRSAHHDHSTENYRTSFSDDLGCGCDVYNLAAHHPITYESRSVGQALYRSGEFHLNLFGGQNLDFLRVYGAVRPLRAFNFYSYADLHSSVFLIDTRRTSY